MTMPASPAATSSRTCFFCCGDIDPVNSATRVAFSSPPSCPAIRQWTQHIAYRPGMLGGKNFRRRQQRALVTGIDHLQHGQHRHDGLSRSRPRPAASGSSDGSRRFLSRDMSSTSRLAAGQFERQPRPSVPPSGRRPRGAPAGPVSDSSPCPTRRPTPTAVPRPRRMSGVQRPRSRSASFSARWIALSASSSDIRFCCHK